jgi:hypothetical protein
LNGFSDSKRLFFLHSLLAGSITGLRRKGDAVLVSDVHARPRALTALLLLRHLLLGLTLQSTADNRVRVRLNGK